MPSPITAYRVFLASPGGLPDERRAFRKVLEDFNEHSGLGRNVMFQAIGWEDTLGGVGRPQQIINEDLRTCDFFIMLLWDRWGTRPDVAGQTAFTSGTEEELSVAKHCLGNPDLPMRQIVIFFKAVDNRRLSDPGEELKQVVGFRNQLESTKEHLYHTFDDSKAFEDLMRRFLNRWLIEHEQKTSPKAILNAAVHPLSGSLRNRDETRLEAAFREAGARRRIIRQAIRKEVIRNAGL